MNLYEPNLHRSKDKYVPKHVTLQLILFFYIT